MSSSYVCWRGSSLIQSIIVCRSKLEYLCSLSHRTRVPFHHTLGRLVQLVLLLLMVSGVRGQRLASPTNGRTEIVSDLGLRQQLLEHIHDSHIILGGTLHITALPVHCGDGLCDFPWKHSLLHVRLICYNNNCHAMAASLDNLSVSRERGRVKVSL